MTNAGFLLSIAYLGIFTSSFLYKSVYSSLQNFNFKNSFVKSVPNKNKIVFEKIENVIYDWSGIWGKKKVQLPFVLDIHILHWGGPMTQLILIRNSKEISVILNKQFTVPVNISLRNLLKPTQF